MLTPDGRLGTLSGEIPGMNAAIVSVTGADANRERTELLDFAPYTSLTNFAGGLVAAGSDARSSRLFALPAGADSFNRAAWAELPGFSNDRQPQVAGGAAGLGVLLERDNRGLNFRRLGSKRLVAGPVPRRALVQRRLRPGAGSARAAVRGLGGRPDQRLAHAYRGRDIHRSRRHLVVRARLLRTRLDVYGDNLYAAVGARGRGALVFFDETNSGLANLGPVQVVRLSPGRIPTSGRRVGRGHVSLRVSADVSCVDERNAAARLQASLRGRRVPVRRFVRGVSFHAAARRLRGGGRFGARYLLRRAPTRVRAHVVPRRGKAFTLRLPMRACL